MKTEDKAKKKKRISTGIILLVVSLAVTCGITLAYMFTKSDVTVNKFEKAVIACEVKETFADGTSKTSVAVTNNSNIPAYLRVRLVSYWVSEDGEQDKIMAKPSALPKFELADGWIDQGNNTYCYNKAIPVNGTTPNLLAEGSVITLREEDGLVQVVEIFADAIQGEPAKKVMESWKVTVDENGVITVPQETE